jgi:hypothetical protein
MNTNIKLTNNQQLIQALKNVLQLASDQADMLCMHGFEDADDYIAAESIRLVTEHCEFLQVEIDNT